MSWDRSDPLSEDDADPLSPDEKHASDEPAAVGDAPTARAADSSLVDRVNPLVSSLCAGVTSEDAELAENAGIALSFLARRQPGKVSTIIGRLVEQIVEEPTIDPVVRTLATLRGEHGREIRGALLTETGYTDARRLYGRIEQLDPWALSDVDITTPDEESDLSFVSRVMRLVELEQQGKNPLESDVWVRFIQRLLGDGGETAPKEDIERAAARQDARPRTVRRRHRQLERIANSRTFRTIGDRSRFDDLEVLSPIRTGRFGKTIRTRGRIGVEEYAITIRLPYRIDSKQFIRLLTEQFREWSGLDDERIATVADWGETPQPWVATEVVERTLASYDRLSTREALEHGETLTRALVSLHQRGIVHGGIDPLAVGYPPNTLDGAVEPMFDHVGMLSVYRKFTQPQNFLDSRYGAPELFDSQYGSVDRATDIYQLGMVLYRALTGTSPFDDGDDLHDRIRTERPPPPSERNPELPERIDDIIAKATAPQKLIRYENATRFHHDIRRLCHDVL